MTTWDRLVRIGERRIRKERHRGHHRGHHDRTHSQKWRRWERFWYPKTRPGFKWNGASYDYA